MTVTKTLLACLGSTLAQTVRTMKKMGDQLPKPPDQVVQLLKSLIL